MNAIGRGSLLAGIVLLAAAVGVLLSGIRTTGEASAPNTVSMADNFFQPVGMTVPAGTTVEWSNDGVLPHTVTSDPGAARTFDSGILRTGGTYSLTFDAPGAFAYHCDVHPEMIGGVVVEAAAAPPPAEEQPPAPDDPAQSGGESGAPETGQPAQSLGETVAPTSGAGALPVGGGAPPIARDMMSGALLLAMSGGILIVLGLSAMGLAARRSA